MLPTPKTFMLNLHADVRFGQPRETWEKPPETPVFPMVYEHGTGNDKGDVGCAWFPGSDRGPGG